MGKEVKVEVIIKIRLLKVLNFVVNAKEMSLKNVNSCYKT